MTASRGRFDATPRNRRWTASSSNPAFCAPRISSKSAVTSVASSMRSSAMALFRCSASPALTDSSPIKFQRNHSGRASRALAGMAKVRASPAFGSSIARSSALRSWLSASSLSNPSVSRASARRPLATWSNARIRRSAGSFGVFCRPRLRRASHSVSRPAKRSSEAAHC